MRNVGSTGGRGGSGAGGRAGSVGAVDVGGQDEREELLMPTVYQIVKCPICAAEDVLLAEGGVIAFICGNCGHRWGLTAKDNFSVVHVGSDPTAPTEEQAINLDWVRPALYASDGRQILSPEPDNGDFETYKTVFQDYVEDGDLKMAYKGPIYLGTQTDDLIRCPYCGSTDQEYIYAGEWICGDCNERWNERLPNPATGDGDGDQHDGQQ